MSDFSKRLAEEIDRLGGITSVAVKIDAVRNTLYNWISKENIPANKLLELGIHGADVQYILTGVRLEAAARQALADQDGRKELLRQGGIAGQSQTQQGSSINEPEQRQTIEVSRREMALIDNIRSCVEEDQRAIERLALRSAEAEQNSIGRHEKPPTKTNKN